MLKTINFYVSPYLVNNNLISLTEFFDLHNDDNALHPFVCCSLFMCALASFGSIPTYNKPTKMYGIHAGCSAHCTSMFFYAELLVFVHYKWNEKWKNLFQLSSDTPTKSVKRPSTQRVYTFSSVSYFR